MTDQVDVAALRAIISRYRRAMIDRDAASACKRAGDMLDASHRAAEAARDMINAAPSLLAEVERLRAENEKLKGRDATAFFTGLRVIRSSWIERGTIIVNDQDMTDAGWPTAALAAQEHPHA